jgi:hypothetical protein
MGNDVKHKGVLFLCVKSKVMSYEKNHKLDENTYVAKIKSLCVY